MTRSRFFARAGVVVAVSLLFFLWHSSLLSPAGRIRGFNSDAAILGLMGKKMLEGRGFDIFFWGQNYIGPFTSMLVAAWGAVIGEAGPLALRLAAFTVALGGLLLTGWATAQVDRRAAVATMFALALTPPVVLRMMITPFGAEMAFLFGAALLAVLVQHVTSERGWLSGARGQIAFGVLAGIAWWMNQQVVFTLVAGAIVLAFRSGVAGALWPREPLPRFTLFVTGAGIALFALFVVTDLGGVDLPFVLGRATDALLVMAIGLLPLLVRLRWRVLPLRPLAMFAAGAAIGYAPVWLGRLIGWYEPSYVFGFQPNSPSAMIAKLRELPPVLEHWTGGVLFGLAVIALAIYALVQTRDAARLLFALIVAGNAAFYLLATLPKPHYLISSVGPLFALAALGALHLRSGLRIVVAIGAALSLAVASHVMHREVLAEPDPLPLLAKVEAAQCAVCYADFWIAYRYRFLDGERRAWIPYLSQNRTPAESRLMQQLPGQRCLVREQEVLPLSRDLPLKHPPPRRATPPARPSV